MKPLLTLLIGLLFCGSSFGQGSWELLYPSPTDLKLEKVQVSESGFIWIVGEDGKLISSDDQGENWEHHALGTHRDLTDLWIERSDIWIVGESGVFFHSDDAGVTWESIESGTEYNLRSIQFVDRYSGWIMSDHKLMLKTVDGGNSWTTIDSISNYPLNDFHFISSEIGWLCTGYFDDSEDSMWAEGELLKTEDGGETWSSIDSGLTLYSSIYFIDDSIGWIQSFNLEDYDVVQRTTDSGTTWENTVWPAKFKTLNFIWPYLGWGITDTSIYISEDIGVTWEEISRIDTLVSSGSLNDIVFAEFLVGWTVGSRGLIFKSENLGRSWKQVSKTLDVDYGAFEDIKFLDENEGWVVGRQYLLGQTDESLLMHTINGGQSWKRIPINSQPSLNHIRILENNDILIAGEDSLFFSYDAGETWDAVGVDPSVTYIMDIHFQGRNLGWLLAGRDLYKTVDGGLTWQFSHNFAAVSMVRTIEFSDSLTAWIVGHNAVEEPTFKSVNGGRTWTRISYDFTEIEFYDDKIGWAVGESQKIYRTTDGGDNWIHINKNTATFTSWTTDLSFTDSLHGFGVNYNRIFYTADGGVTWSKKVPNNEIATIGIRGSHFLNNNVGWIAGSDGLIIKYTNNIVSVDDDRKFPPTKYALHQNHPNPFNPTTTISFALPKAGKTSLVIYDLLGKEVARLVDGEFPAGRHSVTWEAPGAASGIYFYRLQAGGFVETKKMVLLK